MRVYFSILSITFFGAALSTTDPSQDQLSLTEQCVESAIASADSVIASGVYTDSGFISNTSVLIACIDADSVAVRKIAEERQRVLRVRANVRFMWRADCVLYNVCNFARKLNLGMTATYIREHAGYPERINRDVGVWGVKEQWIYNNGELYLYLDNGKLTSWQERDR